MGEKHSNTDADVLIIGAGICGLVAATILEENGLRVCVIEREQTVGGRLATMQVGDGLADTGAQYFAAYTPQFRSWVEHWIDDGLVFTWSNGFSDGSLIPKLIRHTDRPLYAVRGGMNALPKHLASKLKNVHTSREIMTATCDKNGWILQDYDGELYTGRTLLTTLPVPLALTILDEGATILEDADLKALSAIQYSTNLTGVFQVDGPIALPAPGAIQRNNANIVWVGDNQQKGVSPAIATITMQAGDGFSKEHWDDSDGMILNTMRQNLKIMLPEKTTILEAKLHRWQHAKPLTTHHERFLVASALSPLLFAGDAFDKPLVEGAVLSGQSAANVIIDTLL
jgi:renalase